MESMITVGSGVRIYVNDINPSGDKTIVFSIDGPPIIICSSINTTYYPKQATAALVSIQEALASQTDLGVAIATTALQTIYSVYSRR